jgi:hypothetical protein
LPSVCPRAPRRYGLDSASARGEPTGTRKRFAFECLDSTELRPHLAGLMGDRVAEAMVDKGWIEPPDDERVVQVTPSGRRALKRALRLELQR